jgi:hypothetical protein
MANTWEWLAFLIPAIVIAVLLAIPLAVLHYRARQMRRRGIDPLLRTWIVNTSVNPETALQMVISALTTLGATKLQVDEDQRRVTARSRFHWDAYALATFVDIVDLAGGSQLICKTDGRNAQFPVDIGNGRGALKRLVREIYRQNARCIVSDRYIRYRLPLEPSATPT